MAMLLVVIAIGASAVGASGAPLPHPLESGVTDPRIFDSPGGAIALRRVEAAGETTVLPQADWSKIAPGGKEGAGLLRGRPTRVTRATRGPPSTGRSSSRRTWVFSRSSKSTSQ